jgi:hypothetical protein
MSFAFAPSPPSIAFSQATALPNYRSSCDCLDIAYVANDLEVHMTIVSEQGSTVNANRTSNQPSGPIDPKP